MLNKNNIRIDIVKYFSNIIKYRSRVNSMAMLESRGGGGGGLSKLEFIEFIIENMPRNPTHTPSKPFFPRPPPPEKNSVWWYIIFCPPPPLMQDKLHIFPYARKVVFIILGVITRLEVYDIEYFCLLYASYFSVK